MFRNLPTVTKNILIINVIVYFATFVFLKRGIALHDYLGLHYIMAPEFHFWQPLTYMFMHANMGHIFSNMFAVLMFGPALEERWGSRKFLIFYLVTGLGAGLIQECVWAIDLAIHLQPFLNHYSLGHDLTNVLTDYVNSLNTVGASGAVFGILLAFAWFFPDVRMYILFLPIPIRARTLVIIYALFELFAGVAPVADGIAHFAHLGGMVFGWLLILWWRFRGHPGCDAPRWALGRWVKEKWEAVFGKRPPRINRETDEDSKDYTDYHYHGSV
jgi:membrane associated rhomboid family serine protease